jgi:hypothetical protein
VFHLVPRGTEKGRVLVFVPRWLPASQPIVGLPYRVIPIVSALQNCGYAVDLCHELHEAASSDTVRQRVAGACAAVVWCAEMNPAEQMPGILAFLQMAQRTAPEVPRWLGGGFTSLLPRDFDGEGLVQFVRSEETGALAHAIAGSDPILAARQPFAIDALYAMDLEPFVQPAPLVFGDSERSLQLPTGLGCGKHCPFCFYAPTQMRLLPAAAIAEAMQHCYRRYGVARFQLGELDFLAGPRRALDLAERLRTRGSPLRWFALASVQDLLAIGTDGLRALAAAGLTSLELGTETGTDDGLRRLGKRFTVADVVEAQRRLVAAGVRPLHNILIGWPGETVADLRGTRALVAELKGMAAHTVFHFRLYQAIPNTEMGELAMAHAAPMPKRLGEVLAWRQEHQRGMPWLTGADEQRARLWAERLLPLAYGEDDGARTLRRRLLETVARWRCRTGVTAWRVEEQLLRTSDRTRVTWLA